MDIKTVFIVYVCILAAASVIAFILYGADKRRAKTRGMRIKEKHLLALAAFGGAVGAFAGRLVFRHKTDKAYFSAVIYVSLLLQACALALIALVMKGVIV